MPHSAARRGRVPAAPGDHAPPIAFQAHRKPPLSSLRWLLLWASFCLAALPACDRVQQERKETAALKQELAAIQAYSAASEQANAAHRNVIAAFETANRSANLPDYRRVLREQVMPRMDAFLARLAAMPTGTETLRRIHVQLTADYRKARDDIAAYEKTLDNADGLGRFVPIRDALQAGVRTYRKDLDTYYRAHDRQLRLDAAAPQGATSSVAATATAAP